MRARDRPSAEEHNERKKGPPHGAEPGAETHLTAAAGQAFECRNERLEQQKERDGPCEAKGDRSAHGAPGTSDDSLVAVRAGLAGCADEIARLGVDQPLRIGGPAALRARLERGLWIDSVRGLLHRLVVDRMRRRCTPSLVTAGAFRTATRSARDSAALPSRGLGLHGVSTRMANEWRIAREVHRRSTARSAARRQALIMQNRVWRRYFESNLHRPESLVPETIDNIAEPLRAELVRSLRVFQAGEIGEGRIVAQAAREGGARHDADFVEGLRLYIAEEGRHARELGLLVRALGGEPCHTHPSAARFQAVRRVFGFRTKMMVLAGAEVVGEVFYDLLAQRAGSVVITRVLSRIVQEERAHLVFQRDYFASLATTPIARAAYHAALRGMVALELGYFAAEHRGLLRALETSPRDLWEASNGLLRWLEHARVEDLEVHAARRRAGDDASPRERSRSLQPFAWI